MGKRGPPRIAKDVLAARGSRLAIGRHDTEPEPTPGYPRMPAGLSAAAQAEWRRLREEVEPMNLASLADGSPLERIVWLRIVERKLRKWIDEQDRYSYACGTSRQQYPEIGTRKGVAEELRRLEAEFGIGPVSRRSAEIPSAGDTKPVVESRRVG